MTRSRCWSLPARRLDVKNKKGQTPWRIAEGAVFEDAVLAQPQTAALLRKLMESRGLAVE